MTSSRKPDWLKIRPPGGRNYERIKTILRQHGLYTVCEEARCPNVHECWGGGTATFMLMGEVCTRGCRFCAVASGNPRGRLDPFEPMKIAKTVEELQLNYVVLTSVDRDDLADGGANHFAQTIRATRAAHPAVLVEVLIPDFCGDEAAISQVIEADPHVIAHNIETTKALTPIVRDRRAGYGQSLNVLASIKRMSPRVFTKSSIMLGLGESQDAVLTTMQDLHDVGVEILTLGQYLRPTPKHIEVKEFVHPKVFDAYRILGERMGFLYVAAGPLVRSSYRAGEYFIANLVRKGDSNHRAGKSDQPFLARRKNFPHH